MSFSKNISYCRRCVSVLPKRQNSAGTSNTLEDNVKMQAKSVVINQLKLINQLKVYFSKFSNDNKAFENVLNTEFANFLQKIHPRVYGNEFIRYFQSSTVDGPKALTTTVAEKEINNNSSIFPNIINELLHGINGNKEEEKKVEVPKWKTTQSVVSKESIASRTVQILSSLLSTQENNASTLSKIETFITHLKKYPEAKHNSVKDGAIRILMGIREKDKDPTIQGALREAFALLGYTDPVPGSGIRILSIDGGGVRGILVVEMLRKLEELTGKRVHEMFDLICGVSTGAILATLAGLRHKSLDEISEIYKSLSTKIFTQSTLKGTSNLVWSHSYYDTALWEKLLQEQWDDKMLIETARIPNCPKFCAVSAIVNQSRLSAYLFRNYTLPCKIQSQYRGGCNHKVWESVRASAAAPTYFEEYKLGNMLLQDGGILINNPTAVAIHEAKLLWPGTPIQCVVSFGTGRTVPNPIDPDTKPTPINSSSWKNKFFAILDSATDTEGVHTMLSDLLPGNTYYRFNPYLTEMLEMSEIDPKKLEQLERDALMYLRRNDDKFQDAAKALNISKSTTQKVLDWMNYQREFYGIYQS